MSNLTNNRLNTTVDVAVMQQIKNSLESIAHKLPFLLGLTLDERKKLTKVSVANKIFVEDALTAATNNPGFIPSYLDVSGMANDLELYNQLDELQGMLAQLTEMVDDTKRLAGSEAYTAALNCYKHFESAAKAGLPGADTVFDGLRERFKNHSKYNAKE